MNYKISMSEICGILNLKERTAFRRIERAYENLAEALNKSKYCDKLYKLLNGENWLIAIRTDVKDRRLAYRLKEVEINNL